MPWGASQRYDFVIDERNGVFTRVQCKSGVYRFGCIWFRTASADRRRPMGDPYVGQIDAFAVYCAELDSCYLVPIADMPPRQLGSLRVERPANGQTAGIRWAEPYFLGPAGGAALQRKAPHRSTHQARLSCSGAQTEQKL
jgi:hypothetical protein